MWFSGMQDRFDSILPPNLMRRISQEFLYSEQFVNVFSILSLPYVLLYDLMTSILTIAYKSKELQLVVHQQYFMHVFFFLIMDYSTFASG
jgi:hypothetical protein